MLFIRKAVPPARFVKYIQRSNAYFDGMNLETKAALRNALLEEQGYLCAYCMAKLSSDGTGVKIEHYRARNKDNELDYNNLLAVCKGNEGYPYVHQTCDTRKGNEELHINPQKQADIAQLVYTNGGLIKSVADVFQRDLDVILNLNDDMGRLVENRRKVLVDFKKYVSKRLQGKMATYGFWQKCYRFYTEKHEGAYRPYVGILLWYIRKKMQQSQR